MLLALLPLSTGSPTHGAYLSRRADAWEKRKTSHSSWLAPKSAPVSSPQASSFFPLVVYQRSFEFFELQDARGTHCPRMSIMRRKDGDQDLLFSASSLSSKLPPPEKVHQPEDNGRSQQSPENVEGSI